MPLVPASPQLHTIVPALVKDVGGQTIQHTFRTNARSRHKINEKEGSMNIG